MSAVLIYDATLPKTSPQTSALSFQALFAFAHEFILATITHALSLRLMRRQGDHAESMVDNHTMICTI